tara:strand:+ start:102 stop:722 length:621 start_codon:yes stop_codon:yes gene_type:complete
MKKINTIIFDLGGVILNIDYKRTIDEFKKLGIKNAEHLYSKKQQSKLFDEIETGKITKDYFLKILKEKTSNSKLDEVRNAWNALLLNLPEKRIKMLQELKKKYNLFLLSNTNIIHVEALKKKFGDKKYNEFYNLFNKVYYSHEINVRKPSKDAFNIIIKQNKLTINRVLFIDDSPQHISSAKKIGINTLYVDGEKDITDLIVDIIQ